MTFSSLVGWLALVAFQVLVAVSYLVLPWQAYFALLSVLVMGAVFIVRPSWGAFLLIVVVSLVENKIGLFNENLIRGKYEITPVFLVIVLVNMACVGMLKAATSKTWKPLPNPLIIPVCALLLYSALTLFWTPDIEFSLTTISILVGNILVFVFVFSVIDSEKMQRQCLGSWIVTGGLAATLTIASIPLHPQIEIYKNLWESFQFTIFWAPNVGTRGYAISNPNLTALLLSLTSSSVVGLFLVSKSFTRKCLSLALFCFITFANCLTFSKGGVGAFVIMMLFLICFSSDLRKRLVLNVGLFMFGLIAFWSMAVMLANVFGDAFHAQIALGGEGGQAAYSVAARLDYWKDGLSAMARESMFLTGLSIGGYQVYCQRAWAHNLVFSFFFDFGVFGLIFVCTVVFQIVKLLIPMWKTIFVQETYLQKMSVCFLGGLVALSVHSIVDHFYNNGVVWIFLALALPTFILTVREAAGEVV